MKTVAINRSNSFKHRTIITLLITSLLSFLFFGNQAFAYDQPVSTTESSNSTYWSFNDVYAASSIGYMGAEWSSARHAWAFNYRYSGTGSSSGPDDMIRIAAMEIEGTSNTSNMAIWTSNDAKYIGSAPASGTNPDYSDIATAVVDLAITAINRKGASYLWTTAGLISAFRSHVDSSSSPQNSIWRQWNWSPDISNTGQFFWFIVDVEPNQTVQISNNYMLLGPGYELLEAGKGYRNLNAPGPETSSTSTFTTTSTSTLGSDTEYQFLEDSELGTSTITKVIDWNPGMMSQEDKEKYGIEEISRENFAKRAEELDISSRSVEEFNNSGEEVFYYAHNLIEYEVNPSEIEPNANSEKNVLIGEINKNLERSELITRAFSNLEYPNEEDLTIIEKHKGNLEFLKDLLKRAQSISESNTKAIDGLWKELRNEIPKENLTSH
ncbi:hypothetical protein J2S74_002959 [Evansella vedderi]|uniref:Uncharacterized protein n=1 Tax=Evansella vedderi TaxID=38282 RepID=A0ABT9ZWG5_9BACI|nr:hypothetical protein [Evansella vedderi]MDQ0255577.1 hypothetical protein [Evansella vedderi]